jgi:hypothetical protein
MINLRMREDQPIATSGPEEIKNWPKAGFRKTATRDSWSFGYPCGRVVGASFAETWNMTSTGGLLSAMMLFNASTSDLVGTSPDTSRHPPSAVMEDRSTSTNFGSAANLA